MDYIYYIVLAIIVIFFAQRFIPVKGINHINTAELKKILKDKNKQFVDVRTPAEYRANHIREFKNIPLYDIAKKADKLTREKEVVLICQSGMRSQNAAKTLKKLGFTNITNVRGGMNTWR